jgi:hypothetical protein
MTNDLLPGADRLNDRSPPARRSIDRSGILIPPGVEHRNAFFVFGGNC